MLLVGFHRVAMGMRITHLKMENGYVISSAVEAAKDQK